LRKFNILIGDSTEEVSKTKHFYEYIINYNMYVCIKFCNNVNIIMIVMNKLKIAKLLLL